MKQEELHADLVQYVNGTLAPVRYAELDVLLASDHELQAELEFLRSLHAGIRAESVNVPGDFGLARLKRSIHADKRPARTNWWRPVAIAASVLLVAQSALMMTRAPEAPVYAPLSGEARTENTLQVMFSPGATEEQIRHVLRVAEATLVDGPGASGLYRIRLSLQEGSPEYTRAVDMLRGREDIVIYLGRE